MVMLLQTGAIQAQTGRMLINKQVAPIPDKEGFAGMFAGLSNGTLIAAGGANFPHGRPWQGGAKVWYDQIYLLHAESGQWIKAKTKLPVKLAYGVYGTYRNSLIIAGGSDSEKHHREVYRLRVENNDVVIDTLPPMPYALANAAGAVVNDIFFIAGGMENPDGSPARLFIALDLKCNKWTRLEPWPGPERINAVAAAFDRQFYLFSGIRLLENKEREVLADAYRFVPAYKKGVFTGGRWQQLPAMPRGVAAGPGPAPVARERYIIFPGGLDQQTAQHKDPLTHPGFLTGVMAFDTRVKRWQAWGDLPKTEMRLTAPAVQWNDACFIINGETGPGVRTNTVLCFPLQ
ncbi:hypothetical protein LL912_02825 [Niabella sp. CC-SYL272]|uniref:hypothetical protein n=1 Tax=Niabella agricola TaxID=2891571 RepID=UPI001F18B13B|nr:hypothetical protein [Niabella agricola]MCF3107706.1 hypothetical protein [Niabella agricola]